MYSDAIPKAVIQRMPRYYRYVSELMNEGIEKVSSGELSKKMNITASQVRQDFNMFGEFGLKGYGYHVKTLYEEIRTIMGVEQKKNLIVIGAGNLGQALVSYANFVKYGFVMKGMFDVNPHLIGLVVNGIEIQSLDNLENFIYKNNIHIAVLTMPKKNAPAIAERLYHVGIRAIWNFSSVDLNLPDDVVIENVHLSESLIKLAFELNICID